MTRFFPAWHRQLLFILLLCIGSTAQANGGFLEAWHVATSKNLAEHRQWQQLLHVKKSRSSGFKTDIQSKSFYLTDHPIDPNAELRATLEAFWAPIAADKTHALCRYPARRQWLQSQLPRTLQLPQMSCNELEHWLKQDQYQQLYVVHASGYFGNPASAFGHLLLRMGKTDGDKRGLLDMGINFGAKIPPKENPLAYIFKGLFGGYQASFSDKQHYLQDKVYSGTEFRDMWAYRINLTPPQRQLLLYHLWELKAVEFQYYFLRENCAYRIAELLEMVLQESFINHKQPYYLPVDVFYRLTDIDKKRQGSLITEIDFIPSLQREAHRLFKQLTAQEAETANRIIAALPSPPPLQHASAPLLNFLIHYLDYQLVDSDNVQKQLLNSVKNDLLRARFALAPDAPKTKEYAPSLAQLPPGAGPRARQLSLGVTHRRHQKAALNAQIAPFEFQHRDHNRGSLRDATFKVLALEVELDENNISIQRLDILQLERYAQNSAKIQGENSLAWRGRFGLDADPRNCATCLQTELSAGLGKSLPHSRGFFYAMLDAAFTSRNPSVEGYLSIGGATRIRQLPVVWDWESRWRLETSVSNERWQHEINLDWSIDRDHRLGLHWQRREHRTAASLKYQIRW